MKEIIDLLSKDAMIQELTKDHSRLVCGTIQAEALALAASFLHNKRRIVVVKSSLYLAQLLYDRLDGLIEEEECLFFPVDESFRIEAVATSKELLTQRVFVLNKTFDPKPKIIITHTAAILRYISDVEQFKNASLTLSVGQTFKMEQLQQVLIKSGYNRVSKIEHSLQYAMRGGVIDFFSVNYDLPIRVEYFGDEIDSIRFFDLSTQRTVITMNRFELLPATDLIIDPDNFINFSKKVTKSIEKLSTISDKIDLDKIQFDLEEINNNNYSVTYKYYSQIQSNPGCFFDYTKDYQIIYSSIDQVKDTYHLLTKETFEYLEDLKESSFLPFHLHFDFSDVQSSIRHLSEIVEFRKKEKDLEFSIRSVSSSNGNARLLVELLNQYIKDEIKVVLCTENKQQLDCIKNWMQEYNLPFTMLLEGLPKQSVCVKELAIKEGFELIEYRMVYMSAKEIFGGSSKISKSFSKYKDAIVLKNYDSLVNGDYIVHESHGIGQYVGIKTMELEGIHRDYLHILYKDSGVLYVPLEQFKLIRKFVSKDGIVPKLSKLGSLEWQKTKTKIKKRIADIADRLLKLYSHRTQMEGFAFEKDDDWQEAFENSFPYELTLDQKRSVQEIKIDMESPHPMDRLLCGDVGFGKTEVAFIAAFKAIMSGKQVALLCPTTILSKQHYLRALERFQNFPVEVAVLNRFIPLSQQKEIIQKIIEGRVQFVIGTHRILSSSIRFKDLGLLIIDEEQRFGVEHKEKIKEMKTNIDVLTLSATPIPRTLQMAMIGMRSLSQIDTPPKNRMPVQTYVVEKNDKLLKQIIERELGRDGQVFYLYNNVKEIVSVATKIKKLVPSAKISIIHGQMDRDEVDQAMVEFENGDNNIMVCTTIIENGIDIPRANTMIVENADHFGLSQLYQIRGRVGRGDRLGYAYLLYRGGKQMNEIAAKRLKAIKEFTELGSGYRLAMRDLSIRGAGDILGSEQAGFIDTVGMDMYLRLLGEAIEEKKTGVIIEEDLSTKQPLHLNAYIPNQFENDDMNKITLYQRIESLTQLEEIETIMKELRDLYGKIPKTVELLLEKRRLELLMKFNYCESSIDTKDDFELVFSAQFSKIDGIGVILFDYINNNKINIALNYRNKMIRAKIKKGNDSWIHIMNQFLKFIDYYLKEENIHE